MVECRLRSQPPHHGALIAGGNHGNRPRLARRAQHVLHEFAHLAPAFSHQSNDAGVEALRSRQHGEQRGLADAGTGENADALSCAHRGEEIDGFDPCPHRGADTLPPHRCGRLALSGNRALTLLERPTAVDGQAEGVDSAAFPGGVGAERDKPAPPNGGAQAGAKHGLEGLDDDARRIDANDLAELRPVLRRQFHAFAELHESREAAHPAIGRCHLRHAAPDGRLALGRSQE